MNFLFSKFEGSWKIEVLILIQLSTVYGVVVPKGVRGAFLYTLKEPAM
jgi:hypothetical protein